MTSPYTRRPFEFPLFHEHTLSNKPTTHNRSCSMSTDYQTNLPHTIAVVSIKLGSAAGSSSVAQPSPCACITSHARTKACFRHTSTRITTHGKGICGLCDLCLLLRLDDLLDDLLLLNEEGANHTLTDAVCTPRSSVRSRHGLLALAHLAKVTWAASLDPLEKDTAVTAPVQAMSGDGAQSAKWHVGRAHSWARARERSARRAHHAHVRCICVCVCTRACVC